MCIEISMLLSHTKSWHKLKSDLYCSESTTSKTVHFCLSCGKTHFRVQGCFGGMERDVVEATDKIAVLNNAINSDLDSDNLFFNICDECKSKIGILGYAKTPELTDLQQILKYNYVNEAEDTNQLGRTNQQNRNCNYVNEAEDIDQLGRTKQQIRKYNYVNLCVNCQSVTAIDPNGREHKMTTLADKITAIYDAADINVNNPCSECGFMPPMIKNH